MSIRAQAEEEGLDAILIEAGFEWRQPGCSMCLAMNADKLGARERCASTSNRNFEGRQGAGGRTHLLSPLMAAAAAVTGKLTDVRQLALAKLPVPGAVAGSRGGGSAVINDLFAQVTASAGPIIRERDGLAIKNMGSMTAFTTLRGVAAPLEIMNVDTDMIIPKEYLKTIKRSGLGFAAFAELRYENPNQVAQEGAKVAIEKADFVLNKPSYRDSVILVAGDNFGCGSSREHAPWSISDFGIRCIISTSFADIFFNNCFKNGMLPVTLPPVQVAELMADATALKPLEIDLKAQRVLRADGSSFSFDVDPFRKHCLLNGLDDIGLTMQKMDVIRAFEAVRSERFPWLDGATTRVPRLFPVREMPLTPELKTPSPDDWRKEAQSWAAPV